MGITTIGGLNGGHASNIIPDTADIAVSFRTLSTEAYDHLMVRIPEIVDHYVTAWRGTYKMQIFKTPSTVCDPAFSEEIAGFASEVLGQENVQVVPPMKSAEDFGHVTRHVPGFYVCLGAGKPGGFPLHNPNVIFEEDALPLGTSVLVNSALRWLDTHRDT